MSARRHTLNSLGQPIGDALPDWSPPPPPAHEALAGSSARVEPLDAARHFEPLWDAVSQERDGRSWTYLPSGPFPDVDAYRAWFDAFAARDDLLPYAVVRTDDGAAAGVASYLRIEPELGSVEVGHLHFTERLKRSPASTEAMFLMMEHAFALGYRRYEWKCDALNAPSRAAAERLGFRHEGRFRQAAVYKGRNRDTDWYSILDGEWPALREAFRRWLAPENFDADGRQRTRLSELTAAARAGE